MPDMLLAARALNAALEVLKPALEKTGVANIGKVVIGTVAGDIHDIGKNIVASFLRCTGFEVIDLGSNVPDAKFIEEIGEQKPDTLGLSALVTTTMPGDIRSKARSDVFGYDEPGTIKYTAGTGEVNGRERRFLGWFGFSFRLPDGRHPAEMAAAALLSETHIGRFWLPPGVVPGYRVPVDTRLPLYPAVAPTELKQRSNSLYVGHSKIVSHRHLHHISDGVCLISPTLVAGFGCPLTSII